MDEPQEFGELLGRIRQGDARSAEELVRRYEPVLRRSLFVRVRHSPMRRVLDSMDVCQSVFRSFFVRAALGEYDLGSTQDLVNLLLRMAHNKMSDQQERHHAGRRDIRRAAGDVAETDIASSAPSPTQEVEARELLAEARRRFSAEELQLLDLHQHDGLEWADVAARLGGTAEGRRKQWERARQRVAAELGL